MYFFPVAKVSKSGMMNDAQTVTSMSSCFLPQNISRKTKRSRPPNLKDLLLLAVNRMMFPGVRLIAIPQDLDLKYRHKGSRHLAIPQDLDLKCRHKGSRHLACTLYMYVHTIKTV